MYMCPVLLSWYTLDSRPGKKKKERGKIQVSIQFIRNNMTASMFDLSMRDKPRSPFSKLKDKVRGRKHDSDASSAILPRSVQCDTESQPPQQVSDPKPQHTTATLETKPKRSLLPGAQKLSAAHSMSDLVGMHSRPKTDSVNSMEESGESTFCMHSPSLSNPGHDEGCSNIHYTISVYIYMGSESRFDPFIMLDISWHLVALHLVARVLLGN